MGNLVSTKPKLEITETDRAVLTLKTQRRRLEDQRTRALAQMDREEAVARQLVEAGRRERALLALKKRRLQQRQLEKLDAWVLNVEGMLADVEATASQAKMVSALKQGNEALKRMQKEVALEDVEKLMEDTAEAAAYQQQLNQLLGESWTGEDDTAAEAALAELEGVVVAEEAAALPTVPAEAPERPAVTVEPVEAVDADIAALPAAPTRVPTQAPSRRPEELVPAS